jgi:hypothetical protein
LLHHFPFLLLFFFNIHEYTFPTCLQELI